MAKKVIRETFLPRIIPVIRYTYNDSAEIKLEHRSLLILLSGHVFDTCTYIIKLTLYWLNFQEHTINATKYCITNQLHIIPSKYHI